MREIKCKGQRIDNGEWIYGYLIGKDVVAGEIIDFDDEYFATELWYRVVPETVGQSTGLHDKNGVEIYEGDILFQKTTEKFKKVNPYMWEREYVVRYGEFDAKPNSYGFNTIGFYLSEKSSFDFLKGISSIQRDNVENFYPFEVIGNIHEKEK